MVVIPSEKGCGRDGESVGESEGEAMDIWGAIPLAKSLPFRHDNNIPYEIFHPR
jgi:hypothetical protein